MELAFFADEVSKEDFDEAVRLGVEAGATGVELRGGIWGRRIQEIDINRIGGQGENLFVIARASRPTEKSWPRPGRNMLVALILSTLISVGLCFFLNYMDTTLKG